MSWGTAARDNGTFCVSCHTAVPYALARSRLAAALPHSDDRAERALLEDVRKRVRLWSEEGPYYSDQDSGPGKTAESRGTEAVLNALILACDDAPGGRLGADTRAALADMWALQRRDGDAAGSWSWLDFDLAPWEVADARYYGAALAALAVGIAPENYRSDAHIQGNLRLLRSYLARNYPRQSLHHRLVLLWAAARLPELLDPNERAALIAQALRAQDADGGWTLPRLMLTRSNRDALSMDSASDGYATGLATLALERAGTGTASAAVGRGLAWLARNQRGHLGLWMRGKESFWVADSLNRRRNPFSNVGRFMTDAATAYAVLALTASPQSNRSSR